MHQYSPHLFYKQTEIKQKNLFLTKPGELLRNFSFTLDRIVLLIWEVSFSIGDGTPLGMALALTDCQHSRNDPRHLSIHKIILVLEHLYPQPSLEIEEVHPKDQHLHMCQVQEAYAEGQESGKPKYCTWTEGNKTKE